LESFFGYRLKIPGAARNDRAVLRIPIFGTLSQSYHLANFCRTLGLLLKSQVRIVQAVDIAGNTLNNLAYRKEIKIISENLTKGGKMSTHLELHAKLFPPIVPQMITVGEMTGNLSERCSIVAELYEMKSIRSPKTCRPRSSRYS